MRRFLIFLTLFIAVGAVVGTTMMWTDPTGVKWGMDPLLDMLRAKMPWPDVFFRSFIPSGLVLLLVNGLPQFAAAGLLIRKHPWAYPVSLACGIILSLWIALEWWIWGPNPIGNFYLALGIIETLSAAIALHQAK